MRQLKRVTVKLSPLGGASRTLITNACLSIILVAVAIRTIIAQKMNVQRIVHLRLVLMVYNCFFLRAFSVR